MDKQQQLEELLVDWEQHRRQGNELTVEEFCKDTPELIPEMSKLIKDFKATDWLKEDDNPDDDLHLPDFTTVSGREDETRLDECKLSLDELCQQLTVSGLMDQEKVGRLRQIISVDDARSFAQQLVSDNKLTRFQASVLVEGQDIPLVLDRYVLLEEVGKGGMGAVYKALHQRMDRVVALKILPKEAVDSPEKVKRFRREVQAAAKLEHPNIVTAFDAHEDKGYHFLVMSLVNGSDLSALVRKQGPVSCANAVDYIAQAARGLDHAHGMGIVHRDIKPGNLLLSKKGKVKVLDMGLARIDGGDLGQNHTMSVDLTQAGMVMGTIAYIAPEQALDTRYADARSDIYSLGCTLYHLLTGKAIYNEDTTMKTIMAHREGAIPLLCDERSDAPAGLDAIFQKMVAKKPQDRFQSMTGVISALEELDIKNEEGTHPVVAGTQALQDTVTLQNTSQDVLEAQPSPQSNSSGIGKRKLLLLAAFAAFIAFAFLGAIIYRIQTDKGTIIVELADKSVAAKLTRSGVIIEDGDREWTINTFDSKPIPAGDNYSAHLPKDSGLTLIVTDDNGTELEAGKFQIRRNGKILVKVTAAEEAIVKNPADLYAREREIAEWATKGIGWVLLEPHPLASETADSLGVLRSDYLLLEDCFQQKYFDIPRHNFIVRGIHNRRKPVTNDDLQSLQDLRSLVYLDLERCPVTDNSMEFISKLANLRILCVSHTAVGDKGISQLSKLTNLESLALGRTKVTASGLSVLKSLPKLHEINLSGAMLTSEAVDVLRTIPTLRELFVYELTDEHLREISRLKQLSQITIYSSGNSYSQSGLKTLAKALPNCDVKPFEAYNNRN